MAGVFFQFMTSEVFAVDATYDESQWVAHHMDRLSIRQKIAQMIMVPIASSVGKHHGMVGDDDARNFRLREQREEVSRLIATEGIGGIICFQGSFMEQVRLLSALQKESNDVRDLPLLVGQDAEWGLAMRLSDVPRLPKNMTLGAIQNKKLLRDYGRLLGFMCRAAGVHINFAPVVDVNTNSDNPVIGIRAFHEVSDEVVVNATVVIEGMLEENILPCVKHFPGHGDTEVDSHKGLPVIKHSKERLHRVELKPFKETLRKFGKQVSLMVAHVVAPELTQSESDPASLSPYLVKNLLRRDLEFDGLVITDALNMQAITKLYPASQAALAAFIAGNDVLLYAQDVEGSIDLIEEFVLQRPEYKKQLDDSVRRILAMKYRVIRDNRVMPIELEPNFFSENQEVVSLKKDLYREAITLVREKSVLISGEKLPRNVGYLKIGGNQQNRKILEDNFPEMTVKHISLDVDFEEFEKTLQTLANNEVLVVSIAQVLQKQSPYGNIAGIDENLEKLLTKIRALGRPMAIVLLTTPYAIKFLGDLETLIVAYEDDIDAEVAALKVFFGQRKASGVLPIRVSF